MTRLLLLLVMSQSLGCAAPPECREPSTLDRTPSVIPGLVTVTDRALEGDTDEALAIINDASNALGEEDLLSIGTPAQVTIGVAPEPLQGVKFASIIRSSDGMVSSMVLLFDPASVGSSFAVDGIVQIVGQGYLGVDGITEDSECAEVGVSFFWSIHGED